MKIKKPALKKSVVSKILKWGLAASLFLVSIGALSGYIAIGRATQALKANKYQEVPIEKENFATSPAAASYANKFIKEFFTWNTEDANNRKDRLAPFLMPDINEQAGLYIENETHNSKYHSSELWKVEETGENTSLVTYKVLHTLNYTEEKKVKKKTIKNVIEKGPFEKWVQVPIITDGINFKINGLLTFTSKPAEAVFEDEKEERDELPEAPGVDKEEIKAFLPTFFKQYANGEQEQLNYLTDDYLLRPLGGVITFQEIQELTVKQDKEDYIVKANAIFKESNTKALMLQKHEMILTKKDGRWLVKKMNDTRGGN